MRTRIAVLLAALAVARGGAPLNASAATHDSLFARAIRAQVRVDSGRRIVVISAGAWDVPPVHGAYGAMHEDHHAPEPQVFTWPVDGWVHGIKLRLHTRDGRELPRTLLHHLAVINFGRRQLLKATPERLVAFGQETEDMHLPASVGIPMTAGMPMVIALAWYNKSDETYRDVVADLVVEWTPASMNPRPAEVYPVSMDAVNAMGVNSGYDLAPGDTRQSVDFTLPVGGRILAAGGHLHDYGTALTLRDVTGGQSRNVLRLASHNDADGHVVSMERTIPGITGNGIRLQKGHVYEVAAVNHNPTGKVLQRQAMAYLVLLYSPAKGEPWPANEPDGEGWRAEMTYLFGAGAMMP